MKSFIHSFDKHSPSASSRPDTILGTRGTTKGKKSLLFTDFLAGREQISKYISCQGATSAEKNKAEKTIGRDNVEGAVIFIEGVQGRP